MLPRIQFFFLQSNLLSRFDKPTIVEQLLMSSLVEIELRTLILLLQKWAQYLIFSELDVLESLIGTVVSLGKKMMNGLQDCVLLIINREDLLFLERINGKSERLITVSLCEDWKR